MIANHPFRNKSIAIIDLEVESSHGITDIGAVKNGEQQFHSRSVMDFKQFLNGVEFICGHNIIPHDSKYLQKELTELKFDTSKLIDTLYLSPLLFPTRPYHALVKDNKLQTEELNNPLHDSLKAQQLLEEEIAAFQQLDHFFKKIFYLLLGDTREFSGFFKFIGFKSEKADIAYLIREKFHLEICSNTSLETWIQDSPIELAYCLALIQSFISSQESRSIMPKWVLMNYPRVEQLMYLLRNKLCKEGCPYCSKKFDAKAALKRFFGHDSYRTYGGKPLQEDAVNAAIQHKSLLAVFPTGGGKSITFQVPALISGEASRALTVVISPLQSLMKDQVDNLEKNSITEAVTINGLLDPIERAKSIERVNDGTASILYISPESLRSRTIENLILSRKIARFVIDEAHCFSSWGQDFRVDYLYIGDFIKYIQEKKNLSEPIPVSCFTATAKQKVIEDICQYFRDKLNIELERFTSKASRTNLHYKVFSKTDEEEKYLMMRDLIEYKNCPTIVYVSRTHKAVELARRLSQDGFNARSYHGKMDKQEKSENQNSFISGVTQIMVATSAFGMGVDKKDVGMVIHYEISDSLENYVQEAGRAGRDEKLSADCYVLFNENDLTKHFILLNQSKLSIKEIQQVWKAIKDVTKFRSKVSQSALEIARKAGWDDSIVDIETRVKTAISALENAGYLKRGQNVPRVFADSISARNVDEAVQKINNSTIIPDELKEAAGRIIKKLISSKVKKSNGEDSAESRVDYISDHLGIKKRDVIQIIDYLREEKILKDEKDLSAFIKRGESRNKSNHIVDVYCKIEKFLLGKLDISEKKLHFKEINEAAEEQGINGISINKIKTIFNFWSIKQWIKRQNLDSKNHVAISLQQHNHMLEEKLEKRQELARFTIDYLFDKSIQEDADSDKEEVLVSFSMQELKSAYEKQMELFKRKVSLSDIEDTLFFLSRIEAIKIEGGFLVVYNALSVERMEENNKKQYTKEDYKQLNEFYENKVQQVHIVGEYATKMIEDYQKALQFVEDYFQLEYSTFLAKYFNGDRIKDIKKSILPSQFERITQNLSIPQQNIVLDQSNYAVVAAGPGSGKTRILVHKLASLLLIENVKHEQLLMLTFSRAAANEFRTRLADLMQISVGNIAINTFHSYCFDLLGKMGNLDGSSEIIKLAIEKIKSSEVELSKITKTVLVIDEAQDMNQEEFELVKTLMDYNEEMRVIMVGDDDQNIYEFRGASSKYLEEFIINNQAKRHELVENYRSKDNLVRFSNEVAKKISSRLKSDDIIAKSKDLGEIRITRYHSNELITPLVKEVLESKYQGSTCVMTYSNEDAFRIAGMLIHNGVQAKLIQSNESFNLYNLVELRYFLDQLSLEENVSVITEEKWEGAKKALFEKYKDSNKLENCKQIIQEFEIIHPKTKYYSDIEILIRESRLEDFLRISSDTVFVSTIHKTKGKEFDNVFLILNNYKISTDIEKRLLYVALTRAKSNLNIHLNTNIFDQVQTPEVIYQVDNNSYPPPKILAKQLHHRDIYLSYFKYKQHYIDQLKSGDRLIVNGDECLNSKNQSVLKFSRSFLEFIEEQRSKQYEIKEIRVSFIVYWKGEKEEKEIKIILPEVYFEKIPS